MISESIPTQQTLFISSGHQEWVSKAITIDVSLSPGYSLKHHIVQNIYRAIDRRQSQNAFFISQGHQNWVLLLITSNVSLFSSGVRKISGILTAIPEHLEHMRFRNKTSTCNPTPNSPNSFLTSNGTIFPRFSF